MVARHVIEAHAAAEAGELALRARFYADAADLGRRAWRLVQRDDTPAAVEAFLKGTRVESWAHQQTNLDMALLVAVHGLEHARRHEPGTLLEAWAVLRVLEVESTMGPAHARRTRDGAWRLAAQLADDPVAAQLRFVAAYTAINGAVKSGDVATAERAERAAAQALRRLGESRYEHAFRSQQAQLAIRQAHFDDAHAFMQANHKARDRRGQKLGPQFTLAHVFLASGEVDEGVDVLQGAINRAVSLGKHQALHAALSYMAPWLQPEMIRIPRPEEFPPRLSLAALN